MPIKTIKIFAVEKVGVLGGKGWQQKKIHFPKFDFPILSFAIKIFEK